MKKLIALLLFLTSTLAFAQKARIVTYAKEGEFFKINYSLDKDADNVQIFVSIDGGKTYSKPLKEIFGDFGKVKAGNRSVFWDFQSEGTTIKSNFVLFKITTGAPETVENSKKVSNIPSANNNKNKTLASKKTRTPRDKRHITFQLETGANISYISSASTWEPSLVVCPGLLFNGDFGHFFGLAIEKGLGQEYHSNIMFEYRFYGGRNYMKGFWFGANIGANPNGGQKYTYSGWERLRKGDKGFNVPCFACHFLIGWQATRWLNFKLSAGIPEVSLGASINLANFFR